MTNLQLTIFTDHVVCENVKLDLEDVFPLFPRKLDS